MKKLIKFISTVLSIMTLGMYGGQKNKGARRLGIPGMALVSSLFGGFKIKHLAFLLLIPVLYMGYGHNSVLMGWFGSDTLVRIVYALLLSIPFYIFSLRRGALASLLLVGAFSVRAGSLGNIGFFGDILIEDIARYGVLGILIAFNVFFYGK